MLFWLRRISRGLLRRVVSQLPESFAQLLFDGSLAALNRVGKDFVTTRRWPKKGDIVLHKLIDPILSSAPGSIGVVIQGPVYQPDNFTVETVRYYKTLCPELVIIISTWEDEPKEPLECCRRAGAEIVQSPRPTIPGRLNVNLQAISSQAGIVRAKDLGCRYIAKTRTDQRLYSIHVLLGLPSLLDLCPVRNTSSQFARLISLSVGTFKFSPYFVSDFFMFGVSDDMLSYWSCSLDPCDTARDILTAQALTSSSIDGQTIVAPERYLFTDFLRRTGGGAAYEIGEWWRAVADRLIILNPGSLNVYWAKASCPLADVFATSFGTSLVYKPLSEVDWLTLWVANETPIHVPEHLINLNPLEIPPIRMGAS